MTHLHATPGSSLAGIARCLFRLTADALPAFWDQDVRPWLGHVMADARKIAEDRSERTAAKHRRGSQ